MNNQDMPAYPLEKDAADYCDEGYGFSYPGLTKLEAFTMAAMQGLLSSGCSQNDPALAKESVSAAKATLAELEKAND